MKTIKNYLIISLLALMLFGMLAGGAGAATNVSECGTIISEKGEYVLNTSITDSSVADACITIISSDVVFDGAGYTIGGVDTPFIDGIVVHLDDSVTLTNVTVKNVTSTHWDFGLIYKNVANGTIANITSRSNRVGIVLKFSSSNNVTGNTAYNNTVDGIILNLSISNTLTNNNASSNTEGIFIEDSNNNTLRDNTASSNTNYGIILDSSSNNTLTNNTANSNADYGISLGSSSSNNLTSNNASGNSAGISLDSSSNNTISTNIANSNGNRGIGISESYQNTVSDNIANFNGREGIYLRYSNFTLIGNNTVSSNTGSGILLQYSDDNNLTDNNASNSLDYPEGYHSSGIALDNSNGNNLSNNMAASNNNTGISLNSSVNNNITGNTAYNNTMDGIFLIFSSSNNITDNTANLNENGIDIYSSSNNTLRNNTANWNSNAGIVIDSSDNSTANNNIVSGNIHNGIVLYESNYTGVSNNTATSNMNGGIWLVNSTSNTISFNNASYNNDGINFESSHNNVVNNNTLNSNNINGLYYNFSTGNTITNNLVGNNGNGIGLESSSSNTIYNNYFNNTNNANDDGTNTWNTTTTPGKNIIGGHNLGGNFWSDYTGSDTNGDSLGDTPYYINEGGDYLPLTDTPEITNFTADPNTHISRSNPTIISADVTDSNSNLVSVQFMVVDINNLIRANQTMLFLYRNDTGISGKYRSLPWDGTVLDMINPDGTVRTYITSVYVDNPYCSICQDTIMSPVQFKKNGTTEPVPAFARFNRSTGNLSYLNLLPDGDAEIEDGNSTISVTKFTFPDGIDSPSPVEETSDKTYIIYNITGENSSLNPVLVSEKVPDGNYKILVHAVDTANNNNGAESDIDTTPITTTTTTTGGGGSGSGGGGGGVVTGEPFANIAKSENYDKSLIANTPVTYTFKAPELGIYEIAVTGKESENDIALRVEVLKGTSKLVTAQAPEIVYKNVNVWAGTKRMKEALIRFKVENSWLSSNSLAGSDVKMFHWDGSQWTQLETAQTTKDDTYTYYEAKTVSLSPFAISGLKGGIIVPTATPPQPAVTTAAEDAPKTGVAPAAGTRTGILAALLGLALPVGGGSVSIFWIIGLIIVVAVLYIIRRKRYP
ncbi:MAG: NosD domain-containing protein [Candidatus Methanoperedens sp.]